jgi:hypothetical protein
MILHDFSPATVPPAHVLTDGQTVENQPRELPAIAKRHG